jgi:hypothetical protein
MYFKPVRTTVAMDIELDLAEVNAVVWTGEHFGALLDLLKGKPTMAQVRRVFENNQAQEDITTFFKFSMALADMHARAQTQDMKSRGRA